MLLELQTTFRRSLLEGDDRALGAVILGDGLGVDQRLWIYRNNVFGSLIETLRAAYPAVERLLGPELFGRIAAGYVAEHPPRVPQLGAYGDRLGEFLGGLEPVREHPFLVDLARLEWARIEAYFAADAPPLALGALEAVPFEHYPLLRLELHPSARIVASAFGILRLWQGLEADAGPVSGATLGAGPQQVLVTRPRLVVEMRALGAGDSALLRALQGGAALGDAAAAATAVEPGLDLQACLRAHLETGTFTGFRAPSPEAGD